MNPSLHSLYAGFFVFTDIAVTSAVQAIDSERVSVIGQKDWRYWVLQTQPTDRLAIVNVSDITVKCSGQGKGMVQQH
jgi:hypothetical protein